MLLINHVTFNWDSKVYCPCHKLRVIKVDTVYIILSFMYDWCLFMTGV